MKDYLALLKARRAETRESPDLPKLSKAPSGSFDSALPTHSLAEWVEGHAERTAIIQHDGGVPASYAAAFATLQMGCPANVPAKRWHQFLHDAGVFLDAWGATAEALGWTAGELFGLHPVAPLARYNSMGLLWMLQGETVLMLDHEAARLSGGNAVRRRQLPSALPESTETRDTAEA